MNITFRSAVVGITALAIASCAAYFSVIGISKLFGGSPVSTMIMASVLEAGKLVCASVAYQFWTNQNRKWFVSMIFGGMTLVMMFVTSIGIFGFLSNSYKQVSNQLAISESKIESLEDRASRFESEIQQYNQERDILLQDKQALRQDLSRANQQYAQRGWATDQRQVNRIQTQLESTNRDLDEINDRLSAATDSISSIESRILDINTSDASSVKTKLGPIMQTADLFGIGRDKSALIFIVIIMSVFDPMAVMLVIAFNMMTGRHTSHEKPGEAPQQLQNNDAGQPQGSNQDDSRASHHESNQDAKLNGDHQKSTTHEKHIDASHDVENHDPTDGMDESSEPREDAERTSHGVVHQRKNGSFWIDADEWIESDAAQEIFDRVNSASQVSIDDHEVEDSLDAADREWSASVGESHDPFPGVDDIQAEAEWLQESGQANSFDEALDMLQGKEITKRDIESAKRNLKNRKRHYVISETGGIQVKYE